MEKSQKPRSDRTEFIGAHVTPEVKTLLVREAVAQKTSVSALVYTILERTLPR